MQQPVAVTDFFIPEFESRSLRTSEKPALARWLFYVQDVGQARLSQAVSASKPAAAGTVRPPSRTTSAAKLSPPHKRKASASAGFFASQE